MVLPFELHHLDAVAKLFDDYRIFYGKDTDVSAAKSFLLTRYENKESVIFVAVDPESTIVGFTQLYPLFSSTRMQRLWLLNDLFVSEAFRGQGYSKLLLDGAKQHCVATNGCGVSLETAKSNTIGNMLYPNQDFELDEDHNYYFWTNR